MSKKRAKRKPAKFHGRDNRTHVVLAHCVRPCPTEKPGRDHTRFWGVPSRSQGDRENPERCLSDVPSAVEFRQSRTREHAVPRVCVSAHALLMRASTENSGGFHMKRILAALLFSVPFSALAVPDANGPMIHPVAPKTQVTGSGCRKAPGIDRDEGRGTRDE